MPAVSLWGPNGALVVASERTIFSFLSVDLVLTFS